MVNVKLLDALEDMLARRMSTYISAPTEPRLKRISFRQTCMKCGKKIRGPNHTNSDGVCKNGK